MKKKVLSYLTVILSVCFILTGCGLSSSTEDFENTYSSSSVLETEAESESETTLEFTEPTTEVETTQEATKAKPEIKKDPISLSELSLIHISEPTRLLTIYAVIFHGMPTRRLYLTY